MDSTTTKSNMANDKPPMQNREYWVKHDGKPILVHDYSGLVGDEIAETLETLTELVVSRGIYETLFLFDATDMIVNRKAMTVAKRCGPKVKPYTKKMAVIGVEGVARHLTHVVDAFVGFGLRVFDSREDALDWLVED
ncbi:MAG: STAS/SEC14 domain-containing protein [Deltaproteobacteria bacterium]|nr:STAS/SEC14 domain-containing protein [Deltaproteobacteria bacterium]